MLLSLLLSSGIQLYAGGGKSAAIGIGSGMAGFMLGRATSPREDYVQRETVYVQEPARTVTVQDPYLQRDLRRAQDQLAQERSMRRSAESHIAQLEARANQAQSRISQLESRIAQLEDSFARSERTNDYLTAQNVKLENELKELKAPSATQKETTEPIKTSTPGMNKPQFVESKEEY